MRTDIHRPGIIIPDDYEYVGIGHICMGRGELETVQLDIRYHYFLKITFLFRTKGNSK